MLLMVVIRPIGARLGWLALVLLAPTASARAQDCGPAAIRDAYRQAEAAYERKDFTAAAAQFRPLAEQGLGPAQLRLGQIVAAGAGKPDLMEAYRWFALAADIGVPGAKPELTKLTAQIGPVQIAQAGFVPASWQPTTKQRGPCLAVDPHIKPDGSPGYDFERLINHLIKSPSATGPEERRRDWLMRALESVRTKNPRYLVYFKALYGIGFVGGPGLFATNGQQDDLPTVMVNESYLDKVAPELQSQLVSAAVYGVHAMLMPQAAAPQTAASDSVPYKGYTIHTTLGDDGRRFVEFVKSAIDITEQLPPNLLKMARAVTDLRYEPHPANDARGGAIVLATYEHDTKTGKAYMGYAENYAVRGQVHMVTTLVYGAIYQRRDQATGKTSVSTETTGDCELEEYEIKTMEALKFDAIEINRRYKRRTAHGCS
jgi:hypothetical protein